MDISIPDSITVTYCGVATPTWAVSTSKSSTSNLKMDKWEVQLGSRAIPYYTGFGLRHPATKNLLPRQPYMPKKDLQEARRRPKTPAKIDVLATLARDAEALDMTFDAWCSTFGFNPDSIRDWDTYQACCQIGRALAEIFTPDQVTYLKELEQ